MHREGGRDSENGYHGEEVGVSQKREGGTAEPPSQIHTNTLIFSLCLSLQSSWVAIYYALSLSLSLGTSSYRWR